MVAAAVGVGTAVAGVAGSAMSSNAAGKAADAQSQAAADSNQLQREQYEQNTANFQPYLDAGNAGLNALLYRLGLGTGSTASGGGGRVQTEQEIRDELRGQYTTAANTGKPPTVAEALAQNGMRGANARGYSNATWGYDPQAQRWGYQLEYIQGGDAGGTSKQWVYAEPTGSTPETVDEAGLNAAVQARLAQQKTEEATRQADPQYGSLLSSYEAYKPYAEYSPYQAYDPYKEYEPYKEYVPFSEAQFKADPGYQFRLDQGNQSIQNLAAATGNLNSGRALKDAMTFNSGLASQEYQNAYARYGNDYNTGLNSHLQNYNTGLNSHLQNYQTGLNSHVENYLTGLNSHIQNYNTGFNAFNTDKTNQFNRLAAIAGMGQASASSLAGVSQNYANQVSNNLAQSANAQAAGTVGQSNAINQGLGSLANAGMNYAALSQGAYGGGYTPTTPATGNVNSLYGAWRPMA